MPDVKYSDNQVLQFLDLIYVAGENVKNAAEICGIHPSYANQLASGKYRKIPQYPDLWKTPQRPRGRAPFRTFDADLALRMYATGGWSYRALAEQFKVCKETIAAAVRGHRPTNARRTALSESEIHEMQSMYLTGESMYAIAKKLKRSQTAVRRHLIATGFHQAGN